MTLRRNVIISNLIFLIFVLFLSGCTKRFNTKPVSTPENVYSLEGTEEMHALAFTDARTDSDKPLNIGTLSVELPDMDDEIDYLGENISRVLGAEGIKVSYSKEDKSDIKLKVLNYRIRNLRTSGFSPYHTFITFSADLISSGTSKRITAYFKNSKTPVWAFREVERPCYQIPLEVVVKEIAAKLNAHIFKRVASNETVEKLANSINMDSADAASEQYLKVLVPITNHKETIMREAAISALGILGAKDQFNLLKRIYQTKGNIDKTMALKSIGDLDMPEAREFIAKVKMSEDYSDDETVREVADLYP